MIAAQYWADYLKSRGVTRLFGLPGTESLELVEASRLAGLEFFLTHHEATGTFIAGMLGELTGIPGVCLATRGPGAMNLTSGIAAAHLDRRPMLAVTGDHADRATLPTHQRLPLADFFAPITRASIRVSAATLAEQLPAAFDATIGDLPGPSFLAFPAPETSKEIDPPPATGPAVRSAARTPVPDLRAVLDAIASARRVVILAGLGVVTARAGAELVRLAERLGSPVADSPQLKGWFPNDHPLYLGVFGTHADKPVTALANESDLVLAIGLDSVEFLKPWQVTSRTISLATVGAGEPAIPSELAIDGPLKEMLTALAAEAKPAGSWDRAVVARRRQEIVGGLMPTGEPAAGLMWPQTVVAELQRALPRDGVVTTDIGSHKLLMVLQWIARTPYSFLNSSGQSSMGTGVPFAIASKLASPERPVAAVIGDGGCLMYAGELATLARSGLPVVIVVMVDASLYSIKIKQLRRDYPPVGTEFDLSGMSLSGMARDLGLAATRVTNPAECARAFAEAVRADRPMLVEAAIDPAGYATSQ